MDEKRCFRVLETILSKRFPSHYYMIGGYGESALCIEKAGLKWIVYNGERGNKYNINELDTIIQACMFFIKEMAEDIDELKEMENEFIRLLNNVA